MILYSKNAPEEISTFLRFKIIGKGEMGCIPYINESWLAHHKERLVTLNNISHTNPPTFLIEIPYNAAQF